MSRTPLLPLVLLSVVLKPAMADEVRFKNGDRLTGTVVSLTSGQLRIETQVAGLVTVDLEEVETFSTEKPVEIHLREGEVIKRRVLAAAAGRVSIEQEGVREPQIVELAEMRAINPPPPLAPPSALSRARWTGNLSAGLNTARGDADTDTLNLSVGLTRTAEHSRVRTDISYLYGRQRDPRGGGRLTTQNAWYTTCKYDYLLANHYFVYLHSRLEQDQIADLDLRLIGGLGGGYQWANAPDYRFSTEGGLSWLREDFQRANSNNELSVQLAYDLERRLNPRARLFHHLTWYPSVSDLSDYFLTGQAEVRLSLALAMFANLRLVFDYDSTPAPGRGKSNLKYTLGVGMDF